MKGIPDTGCTSNTIPVGVMKEHGLKMRKADGNEPGMEAYGGSRVDIIGQVSFYYKPRKFKQKKLVKALVSDFVVLAAIVPVGSDHQKLPLSTRPS